MDTKHTIDSSALGAAALTRMYDEGLIDDDTHALISRIVNGDKIEEKFTAERLVQIYDINELLAEYSFGEYNLALDDFVERAALKKVDGLVLAAVDAAAEAQYYKDSAAKARRKRARAESRLDWLKTAIAGIVERHGKKSGRGLALLTDEGRKVSVTARRRAQVEWADGKSPKVRVEASLDPETMQITAHLPDHPQLRPGLVRVKVEVEPDAALVRDALERDIRVEGARLVDTKTVRW